jgi:hypothetical protein
VQQTKHIFYPLARCFVLLFLFASAKKILMLPEFSETTKAIHNLLAQFKHFGKAHTDKTGIMSAHKLKQYIALLLEDVVLFCFFFSP